MPSEFGGKKFASGFKSMIQDELSKVMDEGRAIIRAEVEDLKGVVREQSRAAARAIRAEADHIRQELGEYTGNAAPDEELDAEAVTDQNVLNPVKEDPVKTAADRAAARAAAVAGALPPVSPMDVPAPAEAAPEAPQPVPATDGKPDPTQPSSPPVPDWQRQPQS